MSSEVVTQRAIEYTTNLQLLSQQLGSRLRGAVTVGTHVGERAVPVDQIGSVDVYDIVGRRQNVNYSDTPHRRRWVFPQRRAVHDTIDLADQVELLVSPQSLYARAQSAAMGRKMDRTILEALTGTSVTGQNATGSEAFDTANNQIAAGGTGVTFDKINEAVRRLRQQTRDYSERIYAAVSATAIEDMLDEPELKSADYNSVKVLVNGEVNTFMGVTFIPTEELSALTASSAVFWMKSGIHLGVWEDINGKVDTIPTMEHSTMVSCYSNFGATRLEQAKVVWVLYA